MTQYDLVSDRHSCHESQVQIWRKTNEIGEFQLFYTFLAEQLVDSAYHSQNAPESNRRGFKPSSKHIMYFITPVIFHALFDWNEIESKYSLKSLVSTNSNKNECVFVPRWLWVRIILIIEWEYRDRLKERICKELFKRWYRVWET